MYQVFNCVTGEAMPVISKNPYELAGPLGERKQKQKHDDDHGGVGLYYDLDGNETNYNEEIIPPEMDDEGNVISEGRTIDFLPVMIDAGPVYEWREVVPTDAELLAGAKQVKLAEISSRLAALDLFLPRALEDFWAAENYDVTTLPQIQQDRLAQKVALREKHGAVEAAKTIETVNIIET